MRELMEEQGMKGDTIPIMIGMIVTALVVMVLVYVYYKGWKITETGEMVDGKLPKFNGKQWLSTHRTAAVSS